MKKVIIILFFAATFIACDNSSSSSNYKSTTRRPVFHSEISLDDDNGVTDWGRSGELTPDGELYYNGSVTLYDSDGGSRDFNCFIGNNGGLDQGCRGVVYDGEFYNLDRNDWVTIGEVRYRACGD